jgi:hypothetical protein
MATTATTAEVRSTAATATAAHHSVTTAATPATEVGMPAATAAEVSTTAATTPHSGVTAAAATADGLTEARGALLRMTTAATPVGYVLASATAAVAIGMSHGHVPAAALPGPGAADFGLVGVSRPAAALTRVSGAGIAMARVMSVLGAAALPDVVRHGAFAAVLSAAALREIGPFTAVLGGEARAVSPILSAASETVAAIGLPGAAFAVSSGELATCAAFAVSSGELAACAVGSGDCPTLTEGAVCRGAGQMRGPGVALLRQRPALGEAGFSPLLALCPGQEGVPSEGFATPGLEPFYG